MITRAVFRIAPGQHLHLASSSPRRRELLASLGLEFSTNEAHCEEPLPHYGETGPEYAMRMAAFKTDGIKREPDATIIAADTVVCISGSILGKPHDPSEALQMLQKLNGKTHSVCTGVRILLPDDSSKAFYEISQVTFGTWPNPMLAAYAASGEPLDKAGAYAIQGNGAFLIKSISGSFTNVVGLPLEQLAQKLLSYGIITAVENPASKAI